MKKIAILGSTGSIGTQTLDVVGRNDDLQVVGIAAGSNIRMLEEQIRRFHPKFIRRCSCGILGIYFFWHNNPPITQLSGSGGERPFSACSYHIFSDHSDRFRDGILYP